MALKLDEKKHPREGEVVWHNDSVNDAVSKLSKGEAVWVCSRKLSFLIRRYGKKVAVEPLTWKGKVVFRVTNLNSSVES